MKFLEIILIFVPSVIASAKLEYPVDIAEYLFTRLHQLGIRSVHGVPGNSRLCSNIPVPVHANTTQVTTIWWL